MEHDRYVVEQLEYYRARASEYDEWFLRQGRYDQGKEHTEQWFREVAEVQGVLENKRPFGKVLELACGTGWWTEQLVAGADSVTAVDASAEVLHLNAERINLPNVSYVQADIFEWQAQDTFDFIFFSFWLSHVPPERFAGLWRRVGEALAPGGRVFLVDSLHDRHSTAKDQILPSLDTAVAKRKLNDGHEFEIIKLYYTPESLSRNLEPLGWQVEADQTERFFVYATATQA